MVRVETAIFPEFWEFWGGLKFCLSTSVLRFERLKFEIIFALNFQQTEVLVKFCRTSVLGFGSRLKFRLQSSVLGIQEEIKFEWQTEV